MSAAPLHYTRTARVLHWTMAVLLLGLLALGIYMHDLPLTPLKLRLYSYHKWAGVTAFVLLLLRLAWLARHPAPPLPPGTSPALRLAAKAVHRLLYALMLAIPLSGWLMSSAKGFQTVWFGVLPIPDLLAKNEALGDALQALHQVLNFTLIALLLGHVAAALKHQYIDKDELLARMLPRRRGAGSLAAPLASPLAPPLASAPASPPGSERAAPLAAAAGAGIQPPTAPRATEH